MLHTKTQPGFYSDDTYWTVTFYDRRTEEDVYLEYEDVDYAYEDYCYYKNKWYAKDCKYDIHKRT